MTMTWTPSPSAVETRTLPTADLALILLSNVAKNGKTTAHNLIIGVQTGHSHNNEPDIPALLARVSDAWAWLVSKGLVGPSIQDSQGEWMRVTERGRDVLEAGTTATLYAEERLGLELHPLLDEQCRRQYSLGEFELAAFAAMRAVEVRVRTLAGAPQGELGVKLMRRAFGDGGPLRDPNLEGGEQNATADLFAGAIGVFKNPTSHRVVDFDDPTRAAEVVLLADLLMRIMDDCEARLNGETSPSAG